MSYERDYPEPFLFKSDGIVEHFKNIPRFWAWILSVLNTGIYEGHPLPLMRPAMNGMVPFPVFFQLLKVQSAGEKTFRKDGAKTGG